MKIVGVKTGAGSTEKLVWQDVALMFRGHIKTGVILNRTFKDPALFFSKANTIF